MGLAGVRPRPSKGWLDDPVAELAWLALAIGGWFVVQVWFLRVGQTLGKRMLGLRMVDPRTMEPAPLARLVWLRYVPLLVLSSVLPYPIFVHLVDVRRIIERDRRCSHDRLAGTIVVRAEAPMPVRCM